ncbi:ATP-binding protein [Amycolatopsis sp. NPDC051903]|uniref:ATP-binding protein n=1 Tax=Amycolatopsis sp. NPDC051903 TaxID=3363936 RepID=UPI0037B161B0
MLHVSLLGEQSVTDGATGPALTRSPRAIALVGFLVTHAGLPQPRQRIAALFWPDSSDAQARTNLRRELHHLRQVLGEESALLVTAQDLSWHDTPSCRVDVRVFDAERRAAAATTRDEEVVAHAGAALAEYRGELMPGLADDWLDAPRAELEQDCVALCDLLGDAQARLGDLAGAAETARRRIRLRPLEEVGYRTLMGLQAELGDRAGAVSTYHRCAAVLERELGVVPDRATQAALRRLLADPAPGRDGFESRLVGRAREFALLRELWRKAAGGQPSVSLVRGDPGVGKTRLVVELARLARSQGAVVAGTQCFGTSGRLALAPVADWLRNPVLQPALSALAPVWRAEVDRLVPAGKTGGPPPVVRAVADAWQRHRFFEGLARALTGAGRPTLLVLDNAHWCDQETLVFLLFCLGLEPRAPLLLAATQRTDPGDGALAGWTERLRATGRLTEVDLTPLDAPDTARLAESVSGRRPEDDELALLHAATGGFPLSVVEALRSGGAGPPGDLAAVLEARLKQPAPQARELAGLAAAVGRDFTLDLLTEASDLDAGAVVRAVDELWRLRILREFRDGYDFSHDLLRDTAYQQVSRPRRWLLHRRLAQSLELLHPGDTGSVSAQLAEQYARGGRPDRAVAYYRRAAGLAAGTFAHGEAIRLLREALALLADAPAGPETDRRELEVLEALSGPLNARLGYSSAELQRTLERSIELSERLGQRDSTLVGLVGLWTSRFVQGRTARAHEAAIRALALVDGSTKDELSGSAHFAFAGSSVSLGRPAEALRYFDVAARLTRGAPSLPIGTRPEVHSPAWAAHAHWLLGHDDEALRKCREAVEIARTYPHPYSLAVALAYAGITHQMCGDRERVSAVSTELRELCGRYGFAYYREWGLVLRGWARGDRVGLTDAQRGIANLKAEGSLARMPYWLALQADLMARDGRPGPGRAALDAALVVGQARDDLWWLPEVLRLRSAYDTPERAQLRLKSAVELAAAQGSTTLRLRCERDLERLAD